MRLDKLTSKFQMALADAQSLALGQDHQFIEPAHVMKALLDQEGGSSRHLLQLAGADVSQLSLKLESMLKDFSQVKGSGGDIHISNDSLSQHNQIPTRSFKVSMFLNDNCQPKLGSC